MAKEFISEIANIDFARNRAPVIPEGRFTAVNNTVAIAHHSGESYKTDLSLSADFQMAGRDVRVLDFNGYTSFAGYNKKFINEHGDFDFMSALEEFSRVSIERGVVKSDTYQVLSRHTQADSHEAFLFNMLISWGKARLYLDSNGKDYKFVVVTSPYRDSHCVHPLDAGEDDHRYEIELKLPVSEDILSAFEWERRNKDNYWNKPFVLHYNGSHPNQEEFYLAHTMGRQKSSSLHFDIDIERPAFKGMLLDAVNCRHQGLPDDFSDIPWEDADIIWTWIMDYVRLNRLEQAFAACLETFGAVAVQPQWSTLEGCMWQKATISIVLARFSPTRGRVRTVMSGDPYTPFATASEFILREAVAPTQFLTASGVTNYYMWYGLYTLLHNEARQRSVWNTVFTSVSEELQVLYTPMMRAACISVITGREYSTCMNDGCSMYIDMQNMVNYKEIHALKRLDNTLPPTVKLDAIYAPVSGALVLGTMSGDFEVVQHLKAIYQTEPGSIYGKAYELDELLKIATIYRLFGYDLTVRDNVTGVDKNTWAAVRECIPEPASIEFDPTKITSWSIVGAHQRPGRSAPLPHPAVALTTGLRIQIQTPSISINRWQQRTEPLRPSVMMTKRKGAVEFKVKASMQFNPVTFTARPQKSVQEKDFRSEHGPAPPMKPEGSKITLTQTEDARGMDVGPSDVLPAE
nr:coat protein [Umbelopsis gibberispora virus 2]